VSLVERLQAELKTAMRDHDDLRRDTLRMALSAASYAEKQARRPLTDDETIAVIGREVKTRRESVEAYQRAGRTDLADRESAEVAILSGFLPAPLSEDELRTMVRAAIAETGASSARDLGRVMGVLSPRTRGRADGRAVSAMVSQELARSDPAASGAGGH
jgi:uncharacterized protein YqeY